jgi:hypothetical protein
MARVVGLDGKEVSTRTLPGTVSFEAPGPGFYTVVTPDRTLRVAVNLFDMSVTSINRSNLASASSAPSIAERRFKIEPWMLLLFIALTVLSLEWVTYHRRLTV